MDHFQAATILTPTDRSGNLLILDEAHHAAPSSGGRYGIDSQFTRAIRDLAPRFEHRLFLSATPHNGHSNSFSTLLELLDPYRFTRGTPVRPRALDEVMVRRLKEDIRQAHGGFPERHVLRIPIDHLPEDAPELQLSRLLDRYRTLREAAYAHAPKRQQAAAGLVCVGLQQRLLSSIDAFARILAVHQRTLERAAPTAATSRHDSTAANGSPRSQSSCRLGAYRVSAPRPRRSRSNPEAGCPSLRRYRSGMSTHEGQKHLTA